MSRRRIAWSAGGRANAIPSPSSSIPTRSRGSRRSPPACPPASAPDIREYSRTTICVRASRRPIPSGEVLTARLFVLLVLTALGVLAAKGIGEGVYYAMLYSQDFQWSPTVLLGEGN